MNIEVPAKRMPRLIINTICICILLFVGLLLLSGFTGSYVLLTALIRLLFGFWWFLEKNLPLMSVNPDVVIPGLLAFLLAAGMIHWLGVAWAGKQGRTWGLGLTICLSSLLPILFAIAFLVPGALLQARLLMSEKKITHRGVSEKALQSLEVRNHAQAIRGLMNMEKLDKYPASLKTEYMRSSGSDLIYPASGMPAALDPSFPMIISPAYKDRHGKSCRWVMPVDGEMFEIPAEDLDVWLEKAMEMRQRLGHGDKSEG